MRVRILALLLAAPLAGCPLEELGMDPGGLPPEAVVIGRVAGAPPESLTVEVEGDPRPVLVERDGAFRVDGVPIGDLDLTFADGGALGDLRVTGVEAGERLFVTVRARGDALAVALEDRVPPPLTEPFVVRTDELAKALPPGEIDVDVVVEGDGVELSGAPVGCGDPDRTVLYGNLVVLGHDVTLRNVDVRGGMDVRGDGLVIEEDCGW